MLSRAEAEAYHWAGGDVSRADYEQISARYDSERGGWPMPRDELLADVLHRRVGIRFLDVGCGTGNYLAAQRRHFADAPVRFFGVDPSEGMLRSARAKLDVGVLIRARAEALPFPAACFDVVFSTLAFHHFDDKLRALDEMTRVLKPGGDLKMTNLDPWSVRVWWLYRFFPSAQAIDQRRFWPVPTLIAALEARGLSVDARIERRPKSQVVSELLARAEMRASLHTAGSVGVQASTRKSRSA